MHNHPGVSQTSRHAKIMKSFGRLLVFLNILICGYSWSYWVPGPIAYLVVGPFMQFGILVYMHKFFPSHDMLQSVAKIDTLTYKRIFFVVLVFNITWITTYLFVKQVSAMYVTVNIYIPIVLGFLTILSGFVLTSSLIFVISDQEAISMIYHRYLSYRIAAEIDLKKKEYQYRGTVIDIMAALAQDSGRTIVKKLERNQPLSATEQQLLDNMIKNTLLNEDTLPRLPFSDD